MSQPDTTDPKDMRNIYPASGKKGKKNKDAVGTEEPSETCLAALQTVSRFTPTHF